MNSTHINMYDPSKNEQNKNEDIVKEIEAKIDNYIGNEKLIIEGTQELNKAEEIARGISKGQAVNDEDMVYIRAKNPQMLEEAKSAKNIKYKLELEIRETKTREDEIELINKAKKRVEQLNTFENEKNSFWRNLYLESIEEAKNNSHIENKVERKRKMGVNELV